MMHLIVFFLTSFKSLIKLVQGASTPGLIMHYYRLEIERLESAIKTATSPKNFNGDLERTTMQFPEIQVLHVHSERYGFHVIKEAVMQKIIEVKWVELQYSESNINMVIMSYQKSNTLLQMLKQKYCPDLKGKDYFHSSKSMDNILVMITNRQMHHLSNWVEAKINVLQWVTNIRHEGHCQGETRKMEINLNNCPSEMLQITSPRRFNIILYLSEPSSGY